MLDNLNIRFSKCFADVLGRRETAKLLRHVQFHYTPKHASWLNLAEIEIGILNRQCSIDVFPTGEPGNAKSMLGMRTDTPDAAPSNGASLAKTRIASSGPITFQNFRVDVLGRLPAGACLRMSTFR